jgi:hypothetical protein
MLLWNLDLEGKESDLVNGSRGVVVGWKSKEEKLEEMPPRITKPKTADDYKYKRISENLDKSSIDQIPIVQFRNGRVVDCVPESFTYRILNVGDCVRLQVIKQDLESQSDDHVGVNFMFWRRYHIQFSTH